MIIDKLIDKIKKMQNPSVVGLDPCIDFLPENVIIPAFDKYGETLKGVSEAFLTFNKMIIDEIYDIVPAVKPQIAMYEQYGPFGLSAYTETVKYAKKMGMFVIGDVKRGDIASTAKAYSNAHIGRVIVNDAEFSVFDADFITINPYMGFDSVMPYIDDCQKYDKGIFALVKTSNPGSADIQDLMTVNDIPLHEVVGRKVNEWGSVCTGDYGFSFIGAVVGATHPVQAENLRKIMPHTFFLVPGYGAQGGKAEDLTVCFNKDGIGAIVNSSRGIIAAYKKSPYKNEFSPNNFAKAARQAALDMKNDLNAAISKSS